MNTPADKDNKPLIASEQSLPEITLKAVILGIILTIILAAANAYLGLKVGSTVSASIPAAVISMGILRFFRRSNVLENTMVQIMASVGEALTAGIAFILPALLILHVWDHFNYWQTVMTGIIGGSLGVLFTIPLRRALLKDKTLRYPEAVAIGNVLKASASHDQQDLSALIKGGVVGATIELFQSGFQVLTDSFQWWGKTSQTIYGFGIGLSSALIAAGYIVGVNVAISLFIGVIIGWILGIPYLSWHENLLSAAPAAQIANQIWSESIRYIGVGTMLIGGLWTLIILFKPVMKSMQASFASLRSISQGKKTLIPRVEKDIPIHYVLILTGLLLIPIFFLIAKNIIPTQTELSQFFRYAISTLSTVYILIGGFIFCSVMAYFAGLIGSTNSPVSGLLVCALLVISLILLCVFNLNATFGGNFSLKDSLGPTVAIGCMVIIAAALSISNDTMQDLKVGQIVGATPWKQQVMLFLGVLVSSFVIPPILQLLYNAYGIGGVFPRAGMDPTKMLAAPQAGLMATVAQGAFRHQLKWGMIGMGATIATCCIIIDDFLQKRFQSRLPVLAVGLGIYLPLESSMPVIIGGVLSYLIEKKIRKMPSSQTNNHRHRGLLLTCGIVAGASLMGVMLAIPFAIKENVDALKLVPVGWGPYASVFSLMVTLGLCAWIYCFVLRKK